MTDCRRTKKAAELVKINEMRPNHLSHGRYIEHHSGRELKLPSRPSKHYYRAVRTCCVGRCPCDARDYRFARVLLG